MPGLEALKLRFLVGRRQKDAPVVGVLGQIEQIANNGSKIRNRGGSPEAIRRRHKEEAERILPLITPELVADPKFYSELRVNTHLKVFALLREFVPPDKESKQYGEFESSPTHAVIKSYLLGFVEHKGLLSPEKNGVEFIYKDLADGDNAVRILRQHSEMPPYYLNSVFGEDVGLPPSRNTTRGSNVGPSRLGDFKELVKRPPKK